MDKSSFKNFLSFIQNTPLIIQNIELRSKAYQEFNLVYEYLANHEWKLEDLVERHEYSERAIFQTLAEGYYRLGFVEDVFFQYAKLTYEIWYEKTLEEQERIDKRIHKGTQVHQIAEIFGIQNKPNKAWDYYLAAFVEDTVEARNFNQSQAFRALLRQGLDTENLIKISKFISKLNEVDKRDSLLIVEILKRKFIAPTYEENEVIDHIKLNTARKLWENMLVEEK